MRRKFTKRKTILQDVGKRRNTTSYLFHFIILKWKNQLKRQFVFLFSGRAF